MLLASPRPGLWRMFPSRRIWNPLGGWPSPWTWGDIGADIVFTIQDLRKHQLLRGGVSGAEYFDPNEFRATHLQRCNS